jgi:hypothetical protein
MTCRFSIMALVQIKIKRYLITRSYNRKASINCCTLLLVNHYLNIGGFHLRAIFVTSEDLPLPSYS